MDHEREVEGKVDESDKQGSPTVEFDGSSEPS